MTTLTLNRGSFVKRFTPLFVAGTIGVLSTIPYARQQVASLAGGEASTTALVAAGLIQAAVLVAGSVAVGLALAPRLGLRSLLVERVERGTPVLPTLRRQAPLAAAMGVLGFGLIVINEQIFGRFMPPVKESAAAIVETLSHTTVPSVLMTLLYGGITEEILLRWGVMTLLAWIGWRLFQRGTGAPRAAIMWGAIILAALLFGIGHLPAASGIFGLTPAVIARTIVGNAAFGIIAGWLYWRHSLEAAMLAHMMAHVALTAATLIMMLFR
jgi:hypothetical protein